MCTHTTQTTINMLNQQLVKFSIGLIAVLLILMALLFPVTEAGKKRSESVIVIANGGC